MLTGRPVFGQGLISGAHEVLWAVLRKADDTVLVSQRNASHSGTIHLQILFV